MKVFTGMNVGWRHLIWAETSMHPDYPFKDYLPADYKSVPSALYFIDAYPVETQNS
jgi:hypothetical protein